MSITDSNSGITWGFPDGNDNWGPAMNRSLHRLAYLPSNVVFVSIGLTTPPTSPAIGDRYAVGASPTGAWSGYQTGDIAVYGQNATNTSLGWQRFRPYVGLRALDRNTSLAYHWDGTIWKTEQAPVQPVDLHFDPRDFSGDGSATNQYRTIAKPQQQANWLVTDRNSASFIRNIPTALRNLPSGFDARPLWATDTFSGTGTHGGFGYSYYRLGDLFDLHPTLEIANRLSEVTGRDESLYVYVSITLSSFSRGSNTATLGYSSSDVLYTEPSGRRNGGFLIGTDKSATTLTIPRNGATSGYFATAGVHRFYVYLEVGGSTSDSFSYRGRVDAGLLNRY